MKKRTIVAMAALLSIAPLAHADSQPNRGGPGGPPPSFDDLDSNGDGVVTKDEASGDRMLSKMFDKIDANSDGEITETEFDDGLKKGPGGGMKGGRGGPPSFESLDTNSDGEISKDEASSDPMLSKMFDKMDTNNDGVLSKDEMKMPPPPRS